MTTVSERILALVGSGKLSAAEGERLLGASGEPVERMSPWNPFHRFGGGRAALVGLVLAAAGIALTRSGVRYDGFLDLHIVPTAPPIRTALLEQALAWPLPALLFWAYAIVFNSRVRIIDFFGMTGLARLPLLAMTMLLVPFASSFAPGTSHRPTPQLMLLGLLALGGLSATLVLLYQGFKNASGLRGKRHGAGFAALVVLLELLSKIILWRLA